MPPSPLTAVTYGPPWRVDGPPPIRPPYGLLQTAESPAAGVRIITDVDAGGIERWVNGVAVYPYPIDVGDVYDACATGTDHVDKDFGKTIPAPTFAAFTAHLPITCSTVRVWDDDEFKSRAVLTFTALESFIVAREFMSGNRMINNPHLSDGNGSYPNGSTVTNAMNGLALLEQVIAASGRLGLIHASPQFVSVLREKFAVDNKTGVLRTINGNVVIPDFGYGAGFAPNNRVAATGTQEWIYCSGPVDIRRGEIFTMPEELSQAVDRGESAGATNGRANSVTWRAERDYVATWDTSVQGGVLVDRCKDTCT